ncbi:hypothetical protein VOLCADRAFT_105980 [Volvox carteri f. nagariensis]|uniref:Uncharacterized protein n=1 Tax=Volvox carteri f. nagariensis TaxID=3068 RepID=D8U433_VOLCA|nr:uncharacterized protein VOLCADRAFT_105980 [Volvox carteri f. nagariensis]EFJ45428.1 hypothetical protein VOLCADRAFT_105980 [Volvox carteri f. nagariensis]|eukprot:XP_002953455.1 hypothetical protein VOLCADRAFT_105980 [Volvox carteri f. nagariensis]
MGFGERKAQGPFGRQREIGRHVHTSMLNNCGCTIGHAKNSQLACILKTSSWTTSHGCFEFPSRTGLVLRLACSMHTSMRPLLSSGTSGSIAAQPTAGRTARRLFLAPSSCTASSTCPRLTQVLNPDVELTRTTASAGNVSASASDASTSAVLAAQGLERSFQSGTATWPQEVHFAQDGEHFLRPRASEADEPQPVASTSAPSRDSIPTATQQRRRPWGVTGAAASDAAEPAPLSALTNATSKAQAGELHNTHLRLDPTQLNRIRTSAGPKSSLNSRQQHTSLSTGPRTWPVRTQRPRLRPAPPPLSWPDYPYTRYPVSSACSPYDTAGLKLEALFQCVLHYPRVPPKLLRFLRREVPDGPAGRLAAVTATVERLTDAVGREVAVYLIRRNSWVVLVPADCVAPRMEALRRLLGLPPGGIPDMLRKNPNLLRMEESTLRGRYDALQDALYDAVGFDEHKLRALILKYPLILNFRHQSVHSALMALRVLCSARPEWTTFYQVLSPSQVAFFIRERVITLLRLEYLLLTGGGNGWTLRDIMKMSNNMFRKACGGFRSWMQERLRRLRHRLAAARQAVEARAAAQGRTLSRGELERVAMQVQAQCARAEQERFHRQFVARRQAERRDMEKRMEQRQRAIEEKMGLLKQAGGQADEEEDQDPEEEEEEEGNPPPRQYGKQRQPRLASGNSSSSGGSGAGRSGGPKRTAARYFGPSQGMGAAAAAAGKVPSPLQQPQVPEQAGGSGGVRQGVRHHAAALPTQQPPPVSLSSADPLYRVTLGHVWQRPGSKVVPEPLPIVVMGPYYLFSRVALQFEVFTVDLDQVECIASRNASRAALWGFFK